MSSIFSTTMNLKPFPLKTLVSFSSSSSISPPPPLYSLSIFISHFSTSPTHHYPSRRHDEESRQVKVSVWWDFENCSLPAGANVFKISHMITAAVRANGIKGPVHITAFGDIMQISRTNQEALSSTGIYLAHVPRGGKNSADRSLLVDLMYWVSQNPPPAHLFLISGDRDFASILHRLRMNNYNVLLASREYAPSVLCSAASIMWNWNELLKGENLTGKHYNRPPDGPYGSWYGHDKVPLEDPFLVVEQPVCPQTEELSEGGLDSKPRPIPKAVIRQICQILKSCPNGISITDLRAELKRRQVSLDNDLYGYKKFSRFLLSMPQILRLESEHDGQFLIHGTTPKAGELSEINPNSSAAPVRRNGDSLAVSSRLNGDDSVDGALNGMSSVHPSPEVNTGVTPRMVQKTPTEKVAGALNGMSLLNHSPKVNAGVTPRKVQETPQENDSIKVNAEKPPEEVQQPLPVGQKIAEASDEQVIESHQNPIVEQDSASEVSFFRKVWQRWFRSSNDNSEVKTHVPEKCCDSEGSSEKRNNNTPKIFDGVSSEREEMKEENEAKSCEVAHPVTTASSGNDLTVDNKKSAQASENRSPKRSGLFNRIVVWCKFWRSRQDYEAPTDQSCEKLNQVNNNSLNHVIFTQDSFWKDMEIFMDSPRGLILVTQSMTREEMAENLQKEGPLVLRSVSKGDLLQLVDLLISDKKWIKECPSLRSPFRITRAVEKSPGLGNSHDANGLRSIFMLNSSQANLQPKHEGQKKLQNIPHSGVSSTIINKKATERSRPEILADCEELVKMILKEHPEGYNMGSFRKLFLEKYGYPLDIQRLGYKKLAPLLEKMPGVKLESTYILPTSLVQNDSDLETFVPNIQENTNQALWNSAGVLPDASMKCDDSESTWDELGPVSSTSSNKKETQSVLGSKMTENADIAYPNYEPSVSSDEFSDSEGELSTPVQTGQQQKPRKYEEDSSLLQILDSWYSSKEGEDRKDNPEKCEGLVDCSKYQVKQSDAAGVGIKEETFLKDNSRKQRVHKNYSFVADPAGDDRDKLINGILGSLKKSSHPRMQA